MAEVPAPEAAAPPPPPPVRPWRIVATGLVAAAVVIAAAVGFWFVTRSGPFAEVDPSRWAFEMTQVAELHAMGWDGGGVTVCLVDTGVDFAPPELRHVNLIAWRDLVNGRPQPYDDEGHGTAMAGILFARGRLHGVAPAANVIAVKAIAETGRGSDGLVADAVQFCSDPDGDGSPADGAHVISLSLGTSAHPFLGSATEKAVNDAMDLGVIVVAAAGNDGQNDDGDVVSPASVPRVVAVGAVDRQGVIAPFSSMGRNDVRPPASDRIDPNRKPEVVAPGVLITTLLNGGLRARVSGTSPAAAIVAGIVALLFQVHTEYRHDASLLDALKTALTDGARPAAEQTVPHDDHYGYGIVQGLDTLETLAGR